MSFLSFISHYIVSYFIPGADEQEDCHVHKYLREYLSFARMNESFLILKCMKINPLTLNEYF